jgi:hypothetical protein
VVPMYFHTSYASGNKLIVHGLVEVGSVVVCPAWQSN